MRYHTIDATGAEGSASSQGGNPSSANVSRTRSAESILPPAQDIVTRNFGFGGGGGDGVTGDDGTDDRADDGTEPPEGCRLA